MVVVKPRPWLLGTAGRLPGALAQQAVRIRLSNCAAWFTVAHGDQTPFLGLTSLSCLISSPSRWMPSSEPKSSHLQKRGAAGAWMVSSQSLMAPKPHGWWAMIGVVPKD